MIIRKCGDYFLVKIYKETIGDFNIFDVDDIQEIFQKIFDKIKSKYELAGLIEVDVYVDFNYGMIIEIIPVCDYFGDIDMKIYIHLDNVFLVCIDINNLLDYEEVYYYDDKFYGNYKDFCDNEVLYKNTDIIIDKGIKVY